MLTVKKFCFIADLETGGFLVGWSGIIFSLALSITFISLIAFDLTDVVNYINTRFAVSDSTQLPIPSNNKSSFVISNYTFFFFFDVKLF